MLVRSLPGTYFSLAKLSSSSYRASLLVIDPALLDLVSSMKDLMFNGLTLRSIISLPHGQFSGFDSPKPGRLLAALRLCCLFDGVLVHSSIRLFYSIAGSEHVNSSLRFYPFVLLTAIGILAADILESVQGV